MVSSGYGTEGMRDNRANQEIRYACNMIRDLSMFLLSLPQCGVTGKQLSIHKLYFSVLYLWS